MLLVAFSPHKINDYIVRASLHTKRKLILKFGEGGGVSFPLHPCNNYGSLARHERALQVHACNATGTSELLSNCSCFQFDLKQQKQKVISVNESSRMHVSKYDILLS
jgi:hypothetical protein